MATLMQISESFEASSLLCVCVGRGKAWTLDYVVSYVPAGRGRKRQRGCFLIVSETAHIIFSVVLICIMSVLDVDVL